MNPAQLSAWFAAHRVAVLGGGAAAVAALGVYQRKRKGAAAPGVTAGATIPGTIPAAAVVGGSSPAVYDSTASDLYSLQSQISDLQTHQQTTGGGTAAPAPAPLASTLFAPTYDGNLVRYTSGGISEVESDGSLYNLTPAEWSNMQAKGINYNQLGAPAQPTYYSAEGNLADAAKRQTAGA